MKRVALKLALVVLLAPAGGQAGGTRISVAATSAARKVPGGTTKPAYSSPLAQLAARSGAGRADVFVSGSGDARSLFRARLVERPRLLASDRLVIIVPRANPAGIRAIHDLHIKEAKLVVAGPNVPEGASTRQVLRRIGLSFILQNAVSVEPAAKRVVAKVAAGQADAGFVYATDARAAGSRVRTVAVPPYAQPAVPYEIAVLRPARARPQHVPGSSASRAARARSGSSARQDSSNR